MLENKLSRVAGLTANKTKPSSWGLAELGNTLLNQVNFIFYISQYICYFVFCLPKIYP
jgi:hypothetical protein